MIAKSTYGTPERWPEKSAGVLRPCAGIARLSIIIKEAGQALVFLDFLLRFALVTERCRSARQNEYKARFKSNHISLVTLFILLSFALKASPNLLGMSPYLSKEVLKEASDRTDVLPESVLFEILSANPDELKKGDLISHLENKEEPLPNYMIDILKQMSGGSTAKTALLSQLGENMVRKNQIAKEIINSILIQDEIDHNDLKVWLAKLESYNADKQIIASYISQGEYSNAQTLMSYMPSLYDLSGEKLSSHNDWTTLIDMQIDWKTQGKNLYHLDNAEIAVLSDMAENSTGSAKYIARGILEQFNNEYFVDCSSIPDGNKSAVTYSNNDLAKAKGLSLEASPNPATNYTEFSYTLPFDIENATMDIYDISGRLIEQLQLNSSIKMKAYNTENLKSGTYTISIKTSGLIYSTKLIVQ